MIYYLSLIPVNSYRRMGTVADQILEAKIEFLKGLRRSLVPAGFDASNFQIRRSIALNEG